MRGERGEYIRMAADKKRKEEVEANERYYYMIFWIVRILAVLTQGVFAFLYNGKYNGDVLENTKPDIFKDNKSKSSSKPKDINELQGSSLLRDATLWD